MHNTYVTSAVTIRTRGTLPFSVNDFSNCSNERYHFSSSLSRTCCSCCVNSGYSGPINPSYCHNLYGLRQSSLIQWLPCRKVGLGGFNRCYYSRLPVFFVEKNCLGDTINNCIDETVGRRKAGLRKCKVFEEINDVGTVDEAEVLLSLLTEDVGEECFNVRKETKKLVRKPVLEKRQETEFCNECGSKKRVDLASERKERNGYERLVARKKDRTSREGRTRKEEEMEALLSRENRKARIRDVKKDAVLINDVTDAEKADKWSSSRNRSQKSEERWKTESSMRKENQTVDEEFIGKEERRQRLRKDGSSCSSYYSLSSNGDYESEYDVEFGEGKVSGDSSNAYERNSKRSELVYEEAVEADERREDLRENRLTRKTNDQEFHANSRIIESDFRKKSEKKLTDISTEDTQSKKEIVRKESKASTLVQGISDVKHNSHVKYDDRKVKSTEISKLDEETKHLHRQRDDEVSQRSETQLKHKRFVEVPETHNVNIRTSYGSHKVYTGTDETTAKVTVSRQEAIKQERTAARHSAIENINQSSLKVSETTEAQDIDIRRASSSQKRFETRTKAKEEHTTNVHSSAYVSEKHHYDQVGKLVEFGEKFQQSQDKSTSTMNKQFQSELIREEENVNLANVSSFGSEEQRSQSHTEVIRREDFRSRTDTLTNESITKSVHDGYVVLEKHSKPSSQTLVEPPYQTGATSSFQVESKGERLELGSSSTSFGRHLERSTALHHYEEHSRSESDRGQRSKFTPHEDVTVSAAQLQQSSEHYIGELVDKVKQETVSSEIEKERRTFETAVLHEEQHDGKSLVVYGSGSSQTEENGLKLGSGTKGPSAEMWMVNEPSSVQDPKSAEVNKDGDGAYNVVVKRSGRSLWNIIGDIVRLRWSSKSETQSTVGKTGSRNSPDQSTSSETWFSGHEVEENEEGTRENEKKSNEKGPVSGRDEVRSQFKEGSVSSTYLKHVGSSGRSSSTVPLESSSGMSIISSPMTKETPPNNPGDASSATAAMDSSISLPALRLRRSPVIRLVSEGEEAKTSESGICEQPNTAMNQSEPAVSESEQTRKKLLRKDQVSRDRFDEWEEAYRIEAEQRKIDEMFMREALLEAQKAADKWEVPVGAVLVHDGKIISRGCNLVEELRDSTAHAEMICIREASNMLRTWRLSETTLYVTLEPCPMCAGAILQARVDTVVWGAPNKLLGADGSWIRLFPNGDGGNGLEQNDKPAAPVHPFHPKITIRRGVLSSECADAMQQFFKLRRKKKEKKPESPPPPTCLPIPHHPSKFLTKMHDAFNIMFCL